MADDVQWVQDFSKAQGRPPSLADFVARKQFETEGGGDASWWESYAPDEQTQALQDVPFQTNPGGFTGGTPRPWAATSPDDAEQMAYWQSQLAGAEGGAKDWLQTNMNQLAQANKGAEYNFPEGARQSFLDVNTQPEGDEPAWAARVRGLQSWIDQMMSQGQIGSENPTVKENATVQQGGANAPQGPATQAQGTPANAKPLQGAVPPPRPPLQQLGDAQDADQVNVPARNAANKPQPAKKFLTADELYDPRRQVTYEQSPSSLEAFIIDQLARAGRVFDEQTYFPGRGLGATKDLWSKLTTRPRSPVYPAGPAGRY